MMSESRARRPKLFYTGINLDERVPSDHPLRAVAAVVDFSFVRREVADCYGRNGQVSVDPTVILKLLFLAFYENIRSERELMRQLPLRLDWLWFCQMDLDDSIPDHSVLSKARARWGLEVFERIFNHVLQQCVRAGLVDGQTMYADSTVLKANAAVESRIPRKLWERLEQSKSQAMETAAVSTSHDDDDPDDRHGAPVTVVRASSPQDTQTAQLPAPSQGKFNRRLVSHTDPEAATTSRRGTEVKLGYRDHCLVDDRHGVVVATIATAADADDAKLLVPLLNKCQEYLNRSPARVAADSQYGTKENLQRMHWRGIEPYLKRRAAKNDHRHWLERLDESCDRKQAVRLMKRRLHTIEGRFAQAHVRHGHRRCRWRRRWRVQLQCYLVAMVQNIGKLVRHRRRPRPIALALANVSRRVHRLMLRWRPTPTM
jgi:transposase